MQTNLEQAIEIIKTLPPEDFEKVREVFNEEEKARHEKKEQSNWQIERYKKARKWLDEHSQEYMNQWVCLEGDKLIAHGNDGLEVHRKAKEAGIEIPFVHHIVPEVDWGGW
jgi:ribosomal 30S subunit maturation factor RimM